MSDFVVIEVDDLLKMPEEQTLLIFSYLFKKFESSLEGAPGLLVLGEAWSLLAHPTFQPKIREWLKTLRKANCTVIIETQSLSDAAESGLFDVLLESCPTKIMLPNPAADQGGSEKMMGPKDYYFSFGLNEADIRLIKEAIPKRQYYQVSPLGRRLWELELGPIAKALVAVSDKESLGARQRLEDKHKEKWLGYWLESQGIAGHKLNDSGKTHANAKKRKK